MNIFGFIPLLGFLLLAYVVMMLNGVNFAPHAPPVFSLMLFSGALWQPTVGDILTMIGVVVLFIEILKSTRTNTASMVEHTLSMLVFVVFLVLFITVKGAGSSTFLILTMMSLLDVLAGFIVSLASSRRDIQIG